MLKREYREMSLVRVGDVDVRVNSISQGLQMADFWGT